MPFDGSGNFQRVMNWVADAAASIKIRADRHDQEDDNFASGLSNCLTKDGQTQPTANIPMNGKKITNLANPTANTDAVNKAYADAIRNFNTSIVMTGNDSAGRIAFRGTGNLGLSFEQANLSLGVKQAGNPAGSPDTFVWMPSYDYTGTPLMELKRTGQLNFPTNIVLQQAGVSALSVTDTYGILYRPSLYVQAQAGDTSVQTYYRDSDAATRARFGYSQATGRASFDVRDAAGAVQNTLSLGGNLYLSDGQVQTANGSAAVPAYSFAGASNRGMYIGAGLLGFSVTGTPGLTLSDAELIAFVTTLRVRTGGTTTNLALQDSAGNNRGIMTADQTNARVAISYANNAGATQQTLLINQADGLSVTQGPSAGQVVTTGNMAALTTYQSTNASNISFPVGESILVQRTVNTPRCAIVNPCLSNASTGLYETLGAANAGTPLGGNWNARGRLTDFTYLATRTS